MWATHHYLPLSGTVMVKTGDGPYLAFFARCGWEAEVGTETLGKRFVPLIPS
jgi:hypothetical protein